MALYKKKEHKIWLWKAYDRASGRTLAWSLGGRDEVGFRRLWDKLKKSVTYCYTDNWEVYFQVIPPEKHIAGKEHSHAIERDNSNTRHYSSRWNRRTKICSQSMEMVDLSIRLLEWFRNKKNFNILRNNTKPLTKRYLYLTNMKKIIIY